MAQPLSENDWQDILDDIQDQKAVLLIGPEMMRLNGKTLNALLRDTLEQKNRDDIAYYYERDGFFLFKSPEGKVRAARQARRFFREIRPDETILHKIVRLPFHLIVSLNPDTFISEAFYQAGIKHRFHYFQHRQHDADQDDMEKPAKSLPLVYNLFGCKDQDDSLILDYDDMYKLLQSALGASSVPNKLLRSFREASTYVFLGFEFDKWYSQLLLKFLSENGRREKLISINKPLTDKDTQQFVIRHFQIQFMGDQFDFFNELYQRCDTAGMLREVASEAACPKAVEILKQVASGDIDNALALLLKAAEGKTWKNEVVHLQGRYSLLEKNKDSTDSRDYRTELAKILDAIIELTQNVCA